MHDPGTRLQIFECGDVSWKLFRCSKNDLKAFAATLSQVRKFELQLSTRMDASGTSGTSLETQSASSYHGAAMF